MRLTETVLTRRANFRLQGLYGVSRKLVPCLSATVLQPFANKRILQPTASGCKADKASKAVSESLAESKTFNKKEEKFSCQILEAIDLPTLFCRVIGRDVKTYWQLQEKSPRKLKG